MPSAGDSGYKSRQEFIGKSVWRVPKPAKRRKRK